ncbi:glycosyltransferase family 25 protein [Bradyrhizobium sp. LHD-71]|uniref:glycosyltransferase family 25 protein n=1 Tax=Bradyrhizobium sp. LHD-71 TaxID=3072141 RepID=UPI00280F83D6|nr:glycosyltransferase family 25 protein [Bradyrhizobium sp. LHD-71]MDQ8727656.1 glycosyltransferase family 25 protein [Bradyrhizobium sp. LHD-71]
MDRAAGAQQSASGVVPLSAPIADAPPPMRDGPEHRDDPRLRQTNEACAEGVERVRVVVISLSGSPRRRRVAEQMADTQLQWTFFDALRDLQSGQPVYDESRALRYWGRPLTPSEIGCAASHIAVLTAVSQQAEGEWTVVIEDDVFLDPAFDVTKAIRMCELAGLGYLRLYGRHLASPVHVVWLGQRELVRFKRAPMGTQAYLISPMAARNFLGSFRHLDRPIDWEMDRFWANGLTTYALFPFPCIELSLTSSVTKYAARSRRPSKADRGFWCLWKSWQWLKRGSANIALHFKDRQLKAILSPAPDKCRFG